MLSSLLGERNPELSAMFTKAKTIQWPQMWWPQQWPQQDEVLPSFYTPDFFHSFFLAILSSLVSTTWQGEGGQILICQKGLSNVMCCNHFLVSAARLGWLLSLLIIVVVLPSDIEISTINWGECYDHGTNKIEIAVNRKQHCILSGKQSFPLHCRQSVHYCPREGTAAERASQLTI